VKRGQDGNGGIETAATSLLELLASEASSGRMIAVERVATGSGLMPPLHRRNEDESYYVVEGELTFFVGGDVVHAEPGWVVPVPSHVPRTFRVVSERARWVVLTRVARPAGFEDFGRALACPGEGKGWATAEDSATVAAIAATNGIEVLGPPGSLPSDL
jgi:mannose-6-phosphate isomerase-like protein (cupin superfamily)